MRQIHMEQNDLMNIKLTTSQENVLKQILDFVNNPAAAGTAAPAGLIRTCREEYFYPAKK